MAEPCEIPPPGRALHCDSRIGWHPPERCADHLLVRSAQGGTFNQPWLRNARPRSISARLAKKASMASHSATRTVR